MPRIEFMTLFHSDIRDASIPKQIPEVDYVLSTSVYEHLDDVDGITCAIAKLNSPNGMHLHFVDLHDHYIKYPFETLTFSENARRNFLNHTSNLNRFRLPDYCRVFEKWFGEVDVKILERQEDKFIAARSRIRHEFPTGDTEIDSVALISIFSKNPYKKLR